MNYFRISRKSSSFFAALGAAMHAVEKRFTWGHQANSLSGSLYDIHNMQTVASTKILEHCLNYQNTLQYVDDKDITVHCEKGREGCIDTGKSEIYM